MSPVAPDCPSLASAELVPMLNTIMAARGMVFMLIFLLGLVRRLAGTGVIGLRKLLTKCPNENRMIIALSVEHDSAIDFRSLFDPIALFIFADQIGLLGR